MEQLIKALPAVVNAATNSALVREAACIAAWNHAAGETLRGHSVPFRFEDNRLFVAVADVIWQRQLEPLLGQLRFRINALLGQPLVRRIDLQIAPELLANRTAKLTKVKSLDQTSIPVDLLTAAAKITDSELRNTFLAAAMNCLNRLEQH